MSDHGCDTCEFYFEGACTVLLPKIECPHWKAKPKDDARERVAQYLFRSWARKWKTLVGYEAAYEYISDSFRDEFFADADKLLAIVRGKE